MDKRNVSQEYTTVVGKKCVYSLLFALVLVLSPFLLLT